ncbi:NADPH-dependent F420 reductase [Paenibacillus sacheonensis]|uniref:NAD(P)-binding domain-containing protein n=1 Tax=Paenibacillus sacheonensis TaxID=742054 RepID=A0A7X5C1J3_9BACL|nr:NAD(P)-binding domain-containing protein [Paenibacillus sacheonensis]MBM7566122.1 putative dinucleotide-binding enzyme [Paenibacillus sacheonensis]NBC70335.1 NAD(P)-binding domain-containing protein [Paenibacillus sacheonensis]
MKIASIGSGNMGGTLGKRWAALGHRVMFGTRNPHSEKIKLLLQDAGANAQAGTIKEAAAFGEVILLAVLPDAVEQVLTEAGDLDGKILINCTNRYDAKSADAEVRRLAQHARVVRAFHTLPWEVLANSQYEAGVATVFLSGDDPEAVEAVAALTTQLGLDPVAVGGPDDMAKVETAIGTMWRILAPKFGREFSLSVLRR